MKINESFGGELICSLPSQIWHFMNSSSQAKNHKAAKKIILVMKITTLIMMFALLKLSAATNAQITLKEHNVSLKKVLKSITMQSGYDFVYSNKDFKDLKPVTIDLTNVTVEKALEASFEGQPLQYKISEQTVMVRKKESHYLQIGFAQLQFINVTARVIDSNNQPIAGANVRVKDGKQATITDGNGMFELRGLQVGTLLEISYLGFTSKQVAVDEKLKTVLLEMSTSPLDEVQIQAYGKTSRRLSVGNISTIRSEDIAKAPVTNPLLAIQGRIPGITVEQATGYANGGVRVRIQGVNSIGKGNSPFYVIDGVPFVMSAPNVSGSAVMGGNITTTVSPLSFINPQDIESIDVLKDADATAIYGSQAANGAILITTKKGKSGKTKFEANATMGYGDVPQRLSLLNTEQYLAMRKKAYQNDGLAIPTSSLPANQINANNYDLTVWDQNRYTDWQEEFLGGTSSYSNFSGSLSGGNNNTNFLLSAAYNQNRNFFVTNKTGNQKGSVHANLNHTSTNGKLKMDLSVTYMDDVNPVPYMDLTKYIFLAPNAPELYMPDGSLNWMQFNNVSTWENPLAYMNSIVENKTNNMVSSATLNYEIIKGLKVRTQLGYTNYNTKNLTYSLPEMYRPEQRSSANYLTNEQYANSKVWNVEPQLEYRKLLGNHTVEGLVGTTVKQESTYYQGFYGSNFASDLLYPSIGNASNIVSTGQTRALFRYGAVFGRLNYNYANKYVVNFNIRKDGSSRFGANNLFNTFASIGAGWIFSNEQIVKDKLPWLSYGKLKGSFGTTGNDQIGDYQFLNLYRTLTFDNPYQGIVALTADGLPNADLQWEETKKLQGGIELGFLDDRFLITASFFRNRSGNQLLAYQLPSISGFASYQRNFPALVENKGIELTLQASILRDHAFKWSINANLGTVRNKLIAFPGIEQSSYANSLVVGKPMSIYLAYNYLGLDQNTGLPLFMNADGSTTNLPPTTLAGRNQLLAALPKYTGGISNTFSYRGFDLDVLFQFAKQIANTIEYNGYVGRFVTTSVNIAGNIPVWRADAWDAPGSTAKYPKFTTTIPNYSGRLSASNQAYSDASYIRLKNLSLSYSLPTSLLSKIKVDRLKVYFQGQNLFTITNYLGLDPESQSSTSLPPLRMFTFGLQLGI